MPKAVDDKLDQIKQRFLSNLIAEKISLEKILAEIKEGKFDEEGMKHARMITHKLAGSAKMFGFSELGIEAKKVELELDKLIDKTATIQEINPELKKLCDGFMAALDAICKTHPISEDREEKIEEKYEEATAAEPSECTQEEKKDSEHTTEENNKEFNAGNESYKILIIDDDDAILDVTEQIFTTHGCTVQKAKDGKKGLEILEKENKTLPDLVILDVNMPNMNGFEVLEKIGEDPVLKGVPVIMLTGRTEDESIMESIGSGALDYITKPFDPTSLIKTTLRILRRTHTKVLVVDDDELICELLEQHFRRIGYSVMKEYNGTDGWKTIKEKKPDIVVLDIMMPGMDGMSVLKHAKSDPETQDIPIIMLTAKSQNDNILKGLEGGAHDYVTKPFDVEEIAARVAGILRHRKKG